MTTPKKRGGNTKETAYRKYDDRKRIVCYVELERFNQLDKIAKEKKVSKTDLLNIYIDRCLKEDE